MSSFETYRFKSLPKETFFAPEWDYYIFESYIDQVNFKNLAKFILSKEDEILRLPASLTPDNQGTDDFFKIIKNMSNENIFIISHKGDILFDKFTNIIKFEKEHNFTRLQNV